MDKKVFWMDLKDIFPSQLYISRKKLIPLLLAEGLHPFVFPPIPVKKLRGKIVATDGHTRAVALFLLGYTKARVVWDYDDLDWELYEICMQWCMDENLFSVIDLAKRIISEEEYEKLWYARCSVAQEQMDNYRATLSVRLLHNLL